jgi:predicted aspartyl protease
MKIVGLRIGNGYYVRPTFLSYYPIITNAVTFRIDTGCDITTLSLNDALNLRLDITKLGNSFDVLTPTGKVPTFGLANCLLGFDLGNCFLSEKLDYVHVSFPTVTEYNAEAIKSIPSLLGMDFLQRYIIKCDNNYMYLDR